MRSNFNLNMDFFNRNQVRKVDGNFIFPLESPRLVVFEAPKPPALLRTGQQQNTGLLTLRLLEQLGENVRGRMGGNNEGGFRTGDMYDTGLRDAAAAMDIDTSGLDTEGVKERIRTNRVNRQTAKGQDALAKAAYLAGKGAPVDVPREALQDAVQEKMLARNAAELYDRDRFNLWRAFILVRAQTFAASATAAINFTPPRKMWAKNIVIPANTIEFFAFTALQIMGETMFSGDTNQPAAPQASDSTSNNPLDMELDTVPITGTYANTDAAAAHHSSVSIGGYLERVSSSRR